MADTKEEENNNAIPLRKKFNAIWLHSRMFARVLILVDLISRTSWMLDTIVGNVFITLAPQFLSIFVGIAIVFSLQPVLGTVLIIGVALYLVTWYFTIRPVAALQSNFHKKWREAYGNAFMQIPNGEYRRMYELHVGCMIKMY